MKRIVSSALLACIAISFSGCAAIFRGSNSNLDLASDPAGATVFVNGVPFGKTPVSLRLKSNQTYAIEFKKEGFASVTRNVSNSVGAGWIILDVICGMVPVIIDATTGSWYKLEQKNINVILERQQP